MTPCPTCGQNLQRRSDPLWIRLVARFWREPRINRAVYSGNLQRAQTLILKSLRREFGP